MFTEWMSKMTPENTGSITIDAALTAPEKPGSWSVLHTTSNRPYRQWKATDQIRFPPAKARFVRLTAKKRAQNQNWGGYQLMALEVPVQGAK